MLCRAHTSHFPQLEIRKKKRDILCEKRENWMALKKREFTPESGSVDTYGQVICSRLHNNMCPSSYGFTWVVLMK